MSITVSVENLHKGLKDDNLSPFVESARFKRSFRMKECWLGSYLSLGFVDINLDLSESTEELLGVNFVVSVEAVKVSEDSA